MQSWVVSDRVEAIAGAPEQPTARRFHNPLATEPTPPFPGYPAEPAGTPVDAPSAFLPSLDSDTLDAGLDPGDPIAKLTGRPTPAHEAVPEFAPYGDRTLVRVLAALTASRYGLGEVCGPLLHENRKVTGWTRDAFAYDDRSTNLYQSHPWVLCVRPDGSAFGVIVETTWRFSAQLYDHLLIEVEGPPPAVTVIEGATAAEVVTTLTELTGRIELPPRWALGFQQSKWNYAPADDVRRVAREFRARQLPADVVWVDIDYMDAYKVFTFDPEFGDVAALHDDLHAIGWKAAWMIDPGVKIEPGYHVYDQAVAGDHLLDFEGVVWPGPTVFPDFTRAATRDWWAGLYDEFLATGVDAVWNDMNEPANLEDLPDKALPPDVHHRADDELGGPGPHARYRNIYGLQMTRASHAGIKAARPDQRPFLLTRSTFLGGHRHAATWTGDNVSNWDHLAWSIPMALNLGLSGQPLAGPDIGGFAGECTGELLARWMGIGCLFPFARNHNMKTMPDQEPWAFGAQVEATCRRALERRYRLLPYLYTLAREAATTGLPIMRPAFWADPADAGLRRVDTAFLLGADLYVRADVSADRTGATAPVPVGWRRVEVLDTPVRDRDLPELYLRPGAALPLGPVMQWSDERPLDELTLLAHLDPATGVATGTLYEDAGDGFGYEQGEYRLTEFTVAADGYAHAVTAGDWPADTDRPVTITRLP
ncbi:MAG TPA: TIM-barrel domain-containing protein [Ilumatobacter sp.]|nr:TIM-barrel domain-containing protein [Ilumatobacter sp.]